MSRKWMRRGLLSVWLLGALMLAGVAQAEASPVVIVPEHHREDKPAANWTTWSNNSSGSAQLTTVSGHVYEGTAALRIQDMQRGGVHQNIAVAPGPFTAQLRYYTEAAVQGSISVSLVLKDAGNVNVGLSLDAAFVPLASSTGQWAQLTYSDEIPAEVNGKEVKRAQFYVKVDSGQGMDVYVDAVTLQAGAANPLRNAGFETTTAGVDTVLVAGAGPEAARLTAAANRLGEYIQKATGVRPAVVQQIPSGFTGTAVYVGSSAAADETRHQALLDDLNQDGFLIDSTGGDAITIRGLSARATEYGVYDFLERYVGVRWLFPGAAGEHVPSMNGLAVPQETVLEQPSAVYRFLSGSFGQSAADWAAFNRLTARPDYIEFHHNMFRLFDPAVFADHPEYYAGGVVPTKTINWQPCFNSTTANAAIQRILDYFSANPDKTSYSLGLNDVYSEYELQAYCEPAPAEVNAIGKLNRSNAYYQWVNEIVQGVTAVYPDKYFGLLAYRETYDAPTDENDSPYALHPNVVPFLTSDRMAWNDPDREAAGKATTAEWKASASQLGFYDYLYGRLYNVPRIYMQQMAENYQYAHDQGVIAHYAELHVNWGEGPKPWISARLQWDPEQDVDDLLDEWYKTAVGVQAAPYVQQYYEYWEDIWMTRMFQTDWYQEWKDQKKANFLLFTDLRYMDAVTEQDVAYSRQLLEQAVALAATPQQAERAGLLLSNFEFYEASVLSYPRKQGFTIPASEQEALDQLAVIERSVEMAQARQHMIATFKGSPAALDLRDKVIGQWDGVQKPMYDALMKYVETETTGVVGAQVQAFLDGLTEALRLEFTKVIPDTSHLAAQAVRTEAGKASVMQSVYFDQGPWVDAVPFDEFLVMTSYEEPPVETKVRLLWDDDYLYVGYENFDPDLAGMVTSSSVTANNWWSSGGDDSVETFVTADVMEYTGFFSNANELQLTFEMKDTGKRQPSAYNGWETSAWVGSDRWNVIQAIPFARLGINPSVTQELQGFFFRNYHGKAFYLGWGGGKTWEVDSFRPVTLIEAQPE